MKDYYAILGCKPDTPQEDIIKHARRAAMEVNEAYGVLKDPVARAEYDKTLIKPIPIQTRPPRFSPPPKPPFNLKELESGIKSIAVLIVVVVFVWHMLFNKPAPAPPRTENSYVSKPSFNNDYAISKCENGIKEKLNYPVSLTFRNTKIITTTTDKNTILVYWIGGEVEWYDDFDFKKNFVCTLVENITVTPSRWGFDLQM